MDYDFGRLRTGLDFNQKQVLALLCGSTFSINCLISAQYTLFGPMAIKHGLSEGDIGWIIGLSMISLFTTQIITAIFVIRIGAWFLILGGLFLAAGANILLGCIDHITLYQEESFYTLSILIDIVLMAGVGGFQSGMNRVCQTDLPEHIPASKTVLQIFQSISYSLIPITTGAIAKKNGNFNGFIFASIPAYVFVVAIFVYKERNYTTTHYLKIGVTAEAVHDKESIRTVLPKTDRSSIYSIVFHFEVIILALQVFVFGITANYTSYYVPVYVFKRFHWNQVSVGLLLTVGCTSYSIFCLLSIPLSRKLGFPAVMIFGCFLGFISLILLGPAPFLSMNAHTWLLHIAYMIYRCSQATGISPAQSQLQDFIRENIEVSSAVDVMELGAFIFSMCFNSGLIFGGVFGGQFSQNLGLDTASAIFGFLLLIIGILQTLISIRDRCINRPLRWRSMRDDYTIPTICSEDEDEEYNSSLLASGVHVYYDSEVTTEYDRSNYTDNEEDADLIPLNK